VESVLVLVGVGVVMVDHGSARTPEREALAWEALEQVAAALKAARQAGEKAAEELRRSRDVQAQADQALTDARRVTGSGS
jgi:hypothetical protein